MYALTSFGILSCIIFLAISLFICKMFSGCACSVDACVLFLHFLNKSLISGFCYGIILTHKMLWAVLLCFNQNSQH